MSNSSHTNLYGKTKIFPILLFLASQICEYPYRYLGSVVAIISLEEAMLW